MSKKEKETEKNEDILESKETENTQRASEYEVITNLIYDFFECEFSKWEFHFRTIYDEDVAVKTLVSLTLKTYEEIKKAKELPYEFSSNIVYGTKTLLEAFINTIILPVRHPLSEQIIKTILSIRYRKIEFVGDSIFVVTNEGEFKEIESLSGEFNRLKGEGCLKEHSVPMGFITRLKKIKKEQKDEENKAGF